MNVEDDKPSSWFKNVLDVAIEYSEKNKTNSFVFLISGRWNDVRAKYKYSEAEVAKNYIKNILPDSEILIEEMAVDTAGNFAFSKPFVEKVKPDKVVVFVSRVKEERVKYLANKIYGSKYPLEFVFIDDSFSENPRGVAKESKAIVMYKKMFDHVKDGDDEKAREILMYKTPFYFKDIMDDKEFFDEFWPGGFIDFKEKRLSIDNK